jgi:hypothetical protein
MNGTYPFVCYMLASGMLAGLAFGQDVPPKKETPYETIVRLRREAATLKVPASPAVGPVVAKATLDLVRPAQGGPTGYLGMRRYDTTQGRPALLKDVPADAPREPAYFVIRVGHRDIPAVTYRSTRLPGQVVFCLDTDGDGLLSDERGYLGLRLAYFAFQTYEFGPVYLRQGATNPGGDVFYVQCTNGEWFTLWPAFYREGRVVLNGKTYKIALVDQDFDGRFNESFVPPAVDSRDPGCDVLALDLNGDGKYGWGHAGESEIMPLSKLVKLGGVHYRMDVAEDGGTIEFRQARPSSGQLDLGDAEVVLGLWSDAGHQRVSSFGGKVNLPAGRYAVVTLELTEKDAAGDRWTFVMGKGGWGRLGDFEIRPGATTSFKIGAPFQVKASMQRYGQNPFITVGFELEGRASERYSGLGRKDGKEAPEPGFKIVNGAGQVVHSGRFAYS